MIVRDEGSTLLLITQPDHASLAHDFMVAWRGEGFPERTTRAAALAATRDHDIGWTPFDAEPTVDAASGRPSDFINSPIGIRQAVWRGAMDVLPHRSTYVAALVAQHALTVYRRYRGDPAWTPFLAEMERARDRWFTDDVRPDGTQGGPIDPPLTDRRGFLQDYAIVGTGDLLSLTFCTGWTEPQQAEGYVIVRTGRDIRISPDPFGGAEIAVRVTARRLPNRRYRDDLDLREAWARADGEILDGLASGGDPR